MSRRATTPPQGRSILPALLLCTAVLVSACARPAADDDRITARVDVTRALGSDSTDGFDHAAEVRELSFPADHGAHPDFRTEWWYFTGNLAAADGRRFGYQLTFFRNAVAPPDPALPDRASRWATRQVWMAHLALTDVAGRRFSAHQRFARGALGLAGATARPFRVWVESWSAAAIAPPAADGEPFPLRLTAAEDDVALDLRLDRGDGRVLQGDRGLSVKVPGGDSASYYYSYPRLPSAGSLTVGGAKVEVRGASWLDREWTTGVLAAGQRGWDWFALQLDDARELMFFRLRDDTERRDLDHAVLLSGAPPSKRRLDTAAARLAVLDRWTSPDTGTTYPARWRAVFPDAGLNLEITPVLDDQELDLAVRYWEGAVRVVGTSPAGPVTGRGYVELTGYGPATDAPRGR